MDPAVISREPIPAEVRLQRLERLRDVCGMVAGSLELDQVLPALCEAVRDSFGFSRVALFGMGPCAHRIVGPLAQSDATEAARWRGVGTRDEALAGAGCPAASVTKTRWPSRTYPPICAIFASGSSFSR